MAFSILSTWHISIKYVHILLWIIPGNARIARIQTPSIFYTHYSGIQWKSAIDYFDLNLMLKTQSTFAYYQITNSCYTYFTLCDV